MNTGWFIDLMNDPESNQLPSRDEEEEEDEDEDEEWLGWDRNKCSRMDIIRNKDIRSAVATNPKEIALNGLVVAFQGPCCL